MSNVITKAQQQLTAENLNHLLARGDLSKLSEDQKTSYYMTVCQSLGLNHLTKPFEYIRLNGKEVLYATRACADQLRKIHGVSIKIISAEIQSNTLYRVIVEATDSTGRADSSTAAVDITALKGDALANAIMKCETKAKRRVTLSICGLGMLDENEVESIDEVKKARAKEAQAKPQSERTIVDLINVNDSANTTMHGAAITIETSDVETPEKKEFDFKTYRVPFGSNVKNKTLIEIGPSVVANMIAFFEGPVFEGPLKPYHVEFLEIGHAFIDHCESNGIVDNNSWGRP